MQRPCYCNCMKKLDIKNPFNAPVYYEEHVTSTMDAARSLAVNGEPHGAVILAGSQEHGRGRQGRSWIAGAGEALMFTVILEYPDYSAIPAALTLKAGLAAALAIEELIPLIKGEVKIKWPNDVMIGNRKAAGILAEADGRNVYIGIGINMTQKEFPAEYRSRAVSLVQIFPDLRKNSDLILLEKILFHLYGAINNSGIINDPGKWKDEILERLYKRGETVSFAQGPADSQCMITGILSGIGGGGELLLIPEGGTEQAFFNGELRVYEEKCF